MSQPPGFVDRDSPHFVCKLHKVVFSQFMHQPTIEHWGVVKRLLRYLSGTLDHVIIHYCHSPLMIHAFSDADWACNKDDFTSIGTFIVYLGCNPIS